MSRLPLFFPSPESSYTGLSDEEDSAEAELASTLSSSALSSGVSDETFQRNDLDEWEAEEDFLTVWEG